MISFRKMYSYILWCEYQLYRFYIERNEVNSFKRRLVHVAHPQTALYLTLTAPYTSLPIPVNPVPVLYTFQCIRVSICQVLHFWLYDSPATVLRPITSTTLLILYNNKRLISFECSFYKRSAYIIWHYFCIRQTLL